jgi:hypothetical protein
MLTFLLALVAIAIMYASLFLLIDFLDKMQE